MKKILALLLTLTLLLGLCACGAKPEETVGETAETAAFPVTVTDHAGRTVTVEKEPETIVSGYYISTSLLIALGLSDKLVGIEAKADTRPIYSLSAPRLLELPSVGTAKQFDLETCASLTPDLVILPMKLQSAEQALTDLGFTVLFVNPESRESLGEMVQFVAAATGADASALLSFTAETEEMLTSALAGAETPTVYLAGNSSLLSTCPGTMYQSDMITLAGGKNVAADLTDTYWVDVSYEQVLAWDPDYIVLASDAAYTAADVLADPELSACTAVQNGNVVQIPGDAEAWDSPVPGGILGSVYLASLLHPELVTEAQTVIGDFYETFYGFTYG